MNPDVAVGLCALVAGLAASVIVALAFGSAIARRDRDLQPAQSGADARRCGVDQVSHIGADK